MQTLFGRTGWFALFIAVIVSCLIAPAQAQQGGDHGSAEFRDRLTRGVWNLYRTVREDGSDGEIHYRLTLSKNGEATMIVARSGEIHRSSPVNAAYGSLLSVYLRDDKEIVHKGTWSLTGVDNDQISIILTNIAGRHDNARFTGTRDGRRLRLTSGNTGMYGNEKQFTFLLRRDVDSERRDDRSDRDDYYSQRDDSRDDRDRSGGSLTWQGSVDGGVILYIRDSSVRVETISDHLILNAGSQFVQSLPLRATHVSVVRNIGHGDVLILEQPTSENNYTAVVKILDSHEGRGDCKITLSWE